MASSHKFRKQYKTQGGLIERKPYQGNEIQRQRENCRISYRGKKKNITFKRIAI